VKFVASSLIEFIKNLPRTVWFVCAVTVTKTGNHLTQRIECILSFVPCKFATFSSSRFFMISDSLILALFIFFVLELPRCKRPHKPQDLSCFWFMVGLCFVHECNKPRYGNLFHFLTFMCFYVIPFCHVFNSLKPIVNNTTVSSTIYIEYC
jgi:hypothetical protein